MIYLLSRPLPICGCIRFLTGPLYAILGWVGGRASILLMGFYGPIHSETNPTVIDYRVIETWPHTAAEWVYFSHILAVRDLTQNGSGRLPFSIIGRAVHMAFVLS